MKHLYKKFRYYMKRRGATLSEQEIRDIWHLIYELFEDGDYRVNHEELDMAIRLYDRLVTDMEKYEKDYLRKISRELKKIDRMISLIQDALDDDILEIDWDAINRTWRKYESLMRRMSSISLSADDPNEPLRLPR